MIADETNAASAPWLLYWQWVIWSSLAAIVALALGSLFLTAFHVAGVPESPFVQLFNHGGLSLLAAAGQAFVLHRAFDRISWLGYIALSFAFSMILGTFAIYASPDMATQVSNNTIPDVSTSLKIDGWLELVGLATVSAIAQAFLNAIGSLTLWLSMYRAVYGLQAWLTWNLIGITVPSFLVFILVISLKLNPTDNWPIFSGMAVAVIVASNLISGIGVAQLRAIEAREPDA
jgi:hypothetical protein